MRGGAPIGADRNPFDVLIPQTRSRSWPFFGLGSRFHADLQFYSCARGFSAGQPGSTSEPAVPHAGSPMVEASPLPRRTAQSSACLNANASDAAVPDPVVQHGFQAY
jgi:hypothetical protein